MKNQAKRVWTTLLSPVNAETEGCEKVLPSMPGRLEHCCTYPPTQNHETEGHQNVGTELVGQITTSLPLSFLFFRVLGQ